MYTKRIVLSRHGVYMYMYEIASQHVVNYLLV